MNTKHLILTALLATFTATAQAAIVSGYGVKASAGTASNCPSFCTSGGGGQFPFNEDGNEFQTFASASENSFGSASSSALYTGSTTTFLPELKVNTASGLGRRASATAFGVQGYTFNGADTSITLNFNLHAIIGNNASGYVFNQSTASIAVIQSSSLDWFPSFSTLVFEVANGPNLGSDQVFAINGNSNAPGSISFNVTNGMDFYVVAQLDATAQNGFADASHTFSMNFADDSGLSAASAVPVPAAVWLFGSGLLGLAGIARRKRN